jgi:hypothetical protein
MPYNFKAATLSKNGLVVNLGTTTEAQLGYMTVNTANDWVGRLTTNGKSYTTGPTGAWKNEWLSVYQYLDYGNGICYIGGTGSSGGYTAASTTNTALHNKSLFNFDVVFDCGNTFSSSGAKNIAQTRQDCVALIGNLSNISNISAGYSNEATDFGITSADNEFIAFFAGRKQIDTRVRTTLTTWPSSYVYLNTTADVAGIMATNANIFNIFTPAAGVSTTKYMRNVVQLEDYYSDDDNTNLLTNNVNPIRQYPGFGIVLTGNKTYKNDSTNVLDRLNVIVTLNYMKRGLKEILNSYLFQPNNATTRTSVTAAVAGFLNTSLRSINQTSMTYTVVCNNENNTDASTTLNVKVILTIPALSETIILTIVNSDNGNTLVSVSV